MRCLASHCYRRSVERLSVNRGIAIDGTCCTQMASTKARSNLRLRPLEEFLQSCHLAALASVVSEHLVHLSQIVAGDAVGDDMDGIAGFRHVVAGGLHAGSCISPDDIELGDAAFLDIVDERLARQCVGLRLDENCRRRRPSAPARTRPPACPA